MKLSWIYCYDNRVLPPLYSTRVCVFQTQSGPKLESCTLVEDLYDTDGFRKFWVIKGDTKKKEVTPFAWLKIEDVSANDLGYIRALKKLDLIVDNHTPEKGN